jgi:hypothetical protein
MIEIKDRISPAVWKIRAKKWKCEKGEAKRDNSSESDSCQCVTICFTKESPGIANRQRKICGKQVKRQVFFGAVYMGA